MNYKMNYYRQRDSAKGIAFSEETKMRMSAAKMGKHNARKT